MTNWQQRAFVVMAYASGLMLAAYLAAALALFGEVSAGLVVVAVIIAVFGALGFWSQRTGALTGPSRIFTLVAIAGVAVTAFRNGGSDSYVAPMLVAAPIIAGFFSGRAWALVAGGLSVVVAVGLYFADQGGLVLPAEGTVDELRTIATLVLVTAIALAASAAYVTAHSLRQAMQRQEQGQAKLFSFARNAPIAVAMFDENMRYVEMSERWLADYGLERAAVMGRSHYEVFPEIPARWKAVHARCLAGETLRAESDRFDRADGSTIWLFWEVGPWRNAEGEIGGVIMTTRDISEQKAAEERLEAAKREADAASQAKSEFLASMSHEIRTPLNGVLGMAAALEATGLDNRQRRMLKVINESGTALLGVINDILDLSKIEAGKIELESIPFDLDAVVQSVAAIHELRAREKCLNFHVAFAPRARGEYVGDPTRLRQILHNLLSNAVKFTETGSVTLRVDRTPTDEERMTSLRFEVIDTGVGVAPEAQARLFDDFTQADSSTTRKFGGTGLGLAICKRLCAMMNGDITLQSAPGAGSTFRFNLRVGAAEPAAAPVDRAGGANGAPAGARILVADDHPTNQLVIRTLLEPADVDLTIVDSGRAAVEAWRAHDFDVILMDVSMADMDGVAATRVIRAGEAETGRARTPIVAFTADAMNHQVRAFLAAGMDAHLAKPVDVGELFAVLGAQIAESQAYSAAADAG